MTKEQVYDEQIHPLMAQVIAICEEHKIANVCSFCLDREEGLLCSTVMTEDDFDPPEAFREMARQLFPSRRPSPLMMTVRDGNGTVKESIAILGD